jgi:putative hydrolase of the HAD superfamily
VPRTVEAVTFDFWDTLVAMDGPNSTMRDRQIDGFSDVLLAHGHSYERDHLVEVFAENWSRFEQAWAANSGQYTPADATDFIVERLGTPVTGELRSDLVEAFTEVGSRADLELADGIQDCLNALAGADVRVGIVCDVGLTPSPVLRERLEEFGVLHSFDAWAFSDETGWFKPAPEAFRPALEGLGVRDTARTVHVGDNRRTDVAGAQALGMVAIRYTGFRDASADSGPEGDHVTDDHRAIPSLLGLS